VQKAPTRAGSTNGKSWKGNRGKKKGPGRRLSKRPRSIPRTSTQAKKKVASSVGTKKKKENRIPKASKSPTEFNVSVVGNKNPEGGKNEVSIVARKGREGDKGGLNAVVKHEKGKSPGGGGGFRGKGPHIKIG